MKIVSIILLTIFLNACRTPPPTIKTRPRCGLFLIEEGFIEGEKIYSGKCRCKNYQWTKYRIGSVGESYDISLEECNKLIGWTPDEWQGLFLDFDEFRMWLNDQD